MTSTETAAPDRAVIYLRESVDQDGDAHNVANHLADCRRLTDRRGWTVTRVLCDNDVSATSGKRRPEWETLLRMIEDHAMDRLVVWAADRLLREPTDLELLIKLCERENMPIATATGDLDLSNDQGRLVARILTAVAKGEVERKSARQRLANSEAALAGKRRKGTPRPFGYGADHVTPDPDEAAAVRWAAECLLGGGTVSAVAREWSARGLRPPQAPFGPLPEVPWKRNSVTTILRNPAIAGIRTYRGDEVAKGDWAPVLPRETWEAVRALLDASDRTIVDKNGKARRVRIRTERGVRTLGGGLFLCRCGNTLQGNISSAGKHVYRCNAATRGDRPGPHAQSMTGPVDEHVTLRIIARLARPDLADLVTPKRPDLAPLHTEAASIRANLDELAADRALGLVSRAQMIAATQRGNARLAEISGRLAAAAESSALAPFTAGESARKVWDRLDNSRRRAVIAALCTVTLHPAGRGARVFDPATVTFDPVNAG
jgi:site-specific DNA recombinase